MKKITTIVVIAVALITAVVLYNIFCNTEEEEIKSIKIGVSVYNQYDTFVASLIEQLKETAAKKESEIGVELIIDVVNAAGSQLEQNDQVENFIKNQYDVICVNLVDRTDPTLIIDKAQNADVPLIFFNRELVPEDLKRYPKAYYVGAITIEPGIIQGNLIATLFQKDREKVDKNNDGKIQYIMLEGEAGHQDAIIRTEYSVNTLTEKGIASEKLDYAIANWNRDQAKSKTDKLAEQFEEEIEVIFANNDDMALGAIDSYMAREGKVIPVIVGIDGTEEGFRAIENGTMYGTAYNDVIGQGSSILELSYSLVTGEKLPENIVLTGDRYIRYSYHQVTQENVVKFIN